MIKHSTILQRLAFNGRYFLSNVVFSHSKRALSVKFGRKWVISRSLPLKKAPPQHVPPSPTQKNNEFEQPNSANNLNKLIRDELRKRIVIISQQLKVPNSPTPITIQQLLDITNEASTSGMRLWTEDTLKDFISSGIVWLEKEKSQGRGSVESVIELLRQFAHLGLMYNKLNPPNQRTLLHFLQSLCLDVTSHGSPQSLCQFFALLASLGYDWLSFRFAEQRMLLTALQRILTQRIGRKDVVELVESIGKLRVDKSRLGVSKRGQTSPYLLQTQRLLEPDHEQSHDIKDFITLKDISRLLLGLKRSEFTDKDLDSHPTWRRTINDLLRTAPRESSSELNIDDIYMLFNTLGYFGVFFDIIPLKSREILITVLLDHLSKHKLPSLVNLMSSLSTMHMTSKMLPEELKVILFQVLEDALQPSSLDQRPLERAQIRSTLIYALGELQISLLDLSPQLRQQLLLVIEEAIPRHDIFQLSTTLHGLGRMGFRWANPPSLLQIALDSQLKQLSTSTESPPRQRGKGLGPGLIMTADDITWLLKTLNLVGWTNWIFNHTHPLRVAVLAQITQIYRNNSSEADRARIPTLFQLLGDLNVFHQSLPADCTDTLKRCIEMFAPLQLSGKEVAHLLYGLTKLEFSWDDFSLDQSNALLRMMKSSMSQCDAHALSNMMSSFTLLTFQKSQTSFMDIHMLMMKQYVLLESKMGQSESLTQVAMYMEWLRTFPLSLQKELLKSVRKPAFPDLHFSVPPQQSRAQRTLSEGLAKEVERFPSEVPLVIENEFVWLKSGIFPIDLAVKRKSDGVVVGLIEVDSKKHHNRVYLPRGVGASDAELLQERRDLFKEHLCRYYFPRVPFLRVSGIKEDEDIRERCQTLLKLIKDQQ